jgi:hypothetical protein
MKINILYMQIFYRMPHYTFVNVGQTKSKYYRKLFHIGLQDYIYAWIACAKFHLKAQKAVVFLSCQLTTKEETPKKKQGYCCSDKR